jgi:hypothetical protein
MKLIGALGYIAVMVGAVVLVNADAENNWLAFSIWSAASLVLGWTAREVWLALLPVVAVPIALPFGYADQWLGSDAPLVWLFAAFSGVIQVVLVLAALGARVLYERRQLSHH